MYNSIPVSLTTDFVFSTEFPDVNEHDLTNFDALKNLGDQKMTALSKALGSLKSEK